MGQVPWHPGGIVVQWQAHLAVGTSSGASAATASINLKMDRKMLAIKHAVPAQ